MLTRHRYSMSLLWKGDFFGTMHVFQDYVYVQDQTSIYRMKLPQ